MADLGSLFLAFESQDDSHLLGDMLEDSDEVIILSAVCSFMRRNLTRIQDYFEQTLPRYLPDEASFPHDEGNLRTSLPRNNANRTKTNKKFVWATIHCSTKANPSVSVEDR